MKKEAIGGYSYSVSDEQILEHRKRSIPEIFLWLHNTNELINAFTTEKEKNIISRFRKGELNIENH
ncbi:MAG: hypothetical protein ACK40M_07250 [Flavobacteriales bacterium]